MICADSCAADKLASAPIKQGRVAASAGAYDKRIGIGHSISRNVTIGQVFNRGKRFKQSLDIRDMVLYDNFHKLAKNRL